MSACRPTAASATPRTTEAAAGGSARRTAGLPMSSHAPSSPAAARPPVVAVACSGGRDSTALLHATVSAAHVLGLQVVALHVHHGLNPQADGWLDHLQAQVAQWAAQGKPVRLLWERLQGQPSPGDSIEAWARSGRHQALHRMTRAAEADLLLLGHHRRDQAETFLLQALRGAGMAGLAAMPSRQWRDGVCWARPWLDQSREAVQAYVAQHGLTHIEDDSNQHLRFARNRIRQSVWPALTQTAPGAEAALAQSAAWAQEALALQEEMAVLDLAGWSPEGAYLDVGAWTALSPARLSNLLRAWLRLRAGQAAPATLVKRLLQEVSGAKVGRWPFGEREVQLYRGQLSVAPSRRAASLGSARATGANAIGDIGIGTGTEAGATNGAAATLDLSRPGLYPLPAWRGTLEVFAVKPDDTGLFEGVAASRLIKVELRPREGRTQFQAHAKGIPRSLKKSWQTAGIPSPQREGPLLWGGEGLLFVPGLGLDARQVERSTEPLFSLRWHPDACGCGMDR